MGQLAKGPARHHIINAIDESYAFGMAGNFVVVQPKLIGADALLIDKRMPLSDILDLS